MIEGLERVTWGAIKNEIQVPSNGESDEDIVLVFRGTLNVQKNLELDYRTGVFANGEAGIVVFGDLTIEGALLNFEDDYGPFLHVKGDLKAHSIATGGMRIQVDGNINAQTIIGVYNHGFTHANGTIHAQIIATEHTVEADSGLHGIVYNGWGQNCFLFTNSRPEASEPFEPKGVFTKPLIHQGQVDLNKARQLILKGKPVTLAKPESVREQFVKLISKKLDEPHKVKSISLTQKDLTMLPDELFVFENLEKLDLTHNNLKTLPAAIGKLKHLKELRLRGNGLQTLPESIGECVNLEFLDLEANCLTGLPDSMENCKKLKRVNLRNNPYSYVRRAFGGWSNVEFMDELPKVLTTLPNLEFLSFDDTLIRRLPDVPFASNKLAPVTYSDTLLTHVDETLHPQIHAPDLEKTLEWANDHIRFWFSSDYIRPDYFYDYRAKTYSFTDVTALLKIVIECLVPVAAPYTQSLALFQKECAEIIRRLHWDEELGQTHVQLLFTALAEELTKIPCDEALKTPLSQLFESYINRA